MGLALGIFIMSARVWRCGGLHIHIFDLVHIFDLPHSGRLGPGVNVDP